MNTIHFIDNIHFDYGRLLSNAPSKLKAGEVFVRQGDLDGACAVYSLMMMLIINKKVTKGDLVKRDKNAGYTAKKRLQDKFLSGIIGLYRGGYYFDALAEDLKESFAKVATASTYCVGYPDRDDVVLKDELHNKIMETIDAGKPVEIGFAFKGGNGGHAVVAIGYCQYKSRIQLFCLDPAYNLPQTSLWNTIIEIETKSDKRKTYTDTCFTPEDQSVNSIDVDEILIMD